MDTVAAAVATFKAVCGLCTVLKFNSYPRPQENADLVTAERKALKNQISRQTVCTSNTI